MPIRDVVFSLTGWGVITPAEADLNTLKKLLLLVHDFRVNHAFVLLFFGLRLATFGLRL